MTFYKRLIETKNRMWKSKTKTRFVYIVASVTFLYLIKSHSCGYSSIEYILNV